MFIEETYHFIDLRKHDSEIRDVIGSATNRNSFMFSHVD